MPPTISLGMPVYNGGASVRDAIESMLAQTFDDFELIISDNASTDETAAICSEYAQRDDRIVYVRQSSNIGSEANFRFVLERAQASYFMWAAADDTRTENFLAETLAALEADAACVAATSPNTLEGAPEVHVFGLTGDKADRFHQLLNHAWKSHGFFYSLMRRDVLIHCPMIALSFLGSDWALILYMASKGRLVRTSGSMTTFGTKGMSAGSQVYRKLRRDPVEFFLPFFHLSAYALRLSRDLPFPDRFRIFMSAVKINVTANAERIYSVSYNLYCRTLRPTVHRLIRAK